MILAQTGVGANARDIAASASSLGIVAGDSASSTESEMLIEGWATAVAYEIASAFADNGKIDVDMLIAAGRIPESSQKLGRQYPHSA